MDLAEQNRATGLLCSQECGQVPNDNNKKRWNRYFVNILITFFGISGWVGVQGVFVELPLLVMSTPEGSTLPVYIVILVQLANIIWGLYVFLKKFAPRLSNETVWISGILIVDTIAMGLLACFYNVRTTINGVEHSVIMLILVFFIAINGTCSPVLFLPYLQSFDEIYLLPYFIGQGLGGMIASAIALIQGVGKKSTLSTRTQNSTVIHDQDSSTPNFSPTFHFSLFAIILAASTCAFWLLEYSTTARNQRLPRINQFKRMPFREADQIETTEDNKTVRHAGGLERSTRNYLCLLMGLLCFTAHGFLPSIQAYSSLPYGNLAYHLVVTLTLAADPIACGLAFWLLTPSKNGITRVSSLAFILCSYVTWLAISSPTPLWLDTTRGIVVLIITWVLLTGLISYAKLTIATIFRQQPGNRGLYYIGIASQTGSFCGAIITFYLVNFTRIFTRYE